MKTYLLFLIALSYFISCQQIQRTDSQQVSTPIYLDVSKRSAVTIDSLLGDRAVSGALVFNAGTDSITSFPIIGITLSIVPPGGKIKSELVQKTNRFLRINERLIPVIFPMEDILYQPKNYLIEDKNFHFVLLHLNINKDLIEFEDWDESMHN